MFRKKTARLLPLVAMAMAAGAALAQSSASYRLSEHTFNAGGRPDGGPAPASASYRVRLDAVGDAALGIRLSGASYLADGGFVGAYPPPGEVSGLRFEDRQTIRWSGERSVGLYNLYRDLVSSLSSLGFGDCEQPGLAGEVATDVDTPDAGEGYFYLVTAENRLGEEGTKGFESGGTERSNPDPCP